MSDLFVAAIALVLWLALTVDTHRNHSHVLVDDEDCLHSYFAGKCLFCGRAK